MKLIRNTETHWNVAVSPSWTDRLRGGTKWKIPFESSWAVMMTVMFDVTIISPVYIIQTFLQDDLRTFHGLFLQPTFINDIIIIVIIIIVTNNIVNKQINSLRRSGVQCHPGLTYIFNFWHSGTLALSPERQSARMSEIKNGRLDLDGQV